MSRYDDQYYILFSPPGDDQIYLKPSEITAKRRYFYRKLQPGSPLHFEHAYRGEDKNQWKPTNVLVDSSGMIVTTLFKDAINKFNIADMQTYPSIYLDDDGVSYEDYWYLGFYEELDCMDKDGSDIQEFDFDDEDIDEDDDVSLEVYRYSLDEKVLDPIEEEKRLMFKMGACSDKYIFVHQKIVDIFKGLGAQGVRFIKVSDFHEGMQHA